MNSFSKLITVNNREMYGFCLAFKQLAFLIVFITKNTDYKENTILKTKTQTPLARSAAPRVVAISLFAYRFAYFFDSRHDTRHFMFSFIFNEFFLYLPN